MEGCFGGFVDEMTGLIHCFCLDLHFFHLELKYNMGVFDFIKEAGAAAKHGQIEDFKIEIGMLRRYFRDPFRRLVSETVGARRTDDDTDFWF